jgi:hypothetical protein
MTSPDAGWSTRRSYEIALPRSVGGDLAIATLGTGQGAIILRNPRPTSFSVAISSFGIVEPWLFNSSVYSSFLWTTYRSCARVSLQYVE